MKSVRAVYVTDVPGIGFAVVITCCEERGGNRSVELHILLQQARKRMSRRMSTSAHRSDVSDAELQAYAVSQARIELQDQAGKLYLQRGGSSSGALLPVVELRPSDDSAIRALWFTGCCRNEFRKIAEETWCDALAELLHHVQQLPVIMTEDLS